MKLLGEWNWWAPAPLRRFHDRFGLAEPPEAEAEAGTDPDEGADRSTGIGPDGDRGDDRELVDA